MHARVVNRCIFAAAFLGCLLTLGNVFWREYLMVEYYSAMYSPRTDKRGAMSVRFPQRFPMVVAVYMYGERVEVRNVFRYLYARWRWYDDARDALRDGQGVERYYDHVLPRLWEVCVRTSTRRLRTVSSLDSRTWKFTERQVPVPQFKCRFVRQLPPPEEREHRELFSRGVALIRGPS